MICFLSKDYKYVSDYGSDVFLSLLKVIAKLKLQTNGCTFDILRFKTVMRLT